MFEQMTAASRPRRRSGLALGVAAAAHLALVAGLGLSSFSTVEAIEPPRLRPVILVQLLPPPGGSEGGGPVAPRPPRPQPRARPAQTGSRPAPVQPVEVRPVPTPGSDTATAGSAAVTGGGAASATTSRSGALEGAGGGEGEGGEGLPVPVETRLDDRPLQVGGNVVAPQAIEQVRPRYPPGAAAMGIQGTVNIEAIIDEHGRVVETRVLSGPPALRAAAIEAAERWRFVPASLNGRPVRVYFSLQVTFTLR